MKSFPATNVFDFLRLARSAAREFVSRPFNWGFKSVLGRWMRDLIERRQSQNVVLNFWVKKMLLVLGQDLSAHILSNKSAIAILLEKHDLHLTNKTLVKDPVPFSFSEKEIRFYA